MKQVIRILIVLFIFLLLIFLTASTVRAQQNYRTAPKNQQTLPYKLQYETENVYIDWVQQYDVCAGCPSFLWSVTRTNLNNGRWLFKIYFYSNSYYPDGTWASTYLDGVFLNIDGEYLHKQSAWLLFKEIYTHELFQFTTGSMTPFIEMTWGSITIN